MADKKQPNILFLMVDQMQAEALNSSVCITPNFDKLIERGVSFDRAYAPNPVCSPSRASLMTGLLPHNHGVLHVVHLVDSDQSVIRDDKPHWAQRLKETGYNTAYVGKWHVERTHNLKKYGWDKYVHEENVKPHLVKSRYIKDMEGYPNSLLYGVTDTPAEKRPVGLHTNHALNTLDELVDGNKPWCLFVSTNEPHDPFVCSKQAYDLYNIDDIELNDSYYDNLDGKPNLYKIAANVFSDLSDEEKKEAVMCYYASVTEVDKQYGKLIDKLYERGISDDTIVIFTSDHGEFLGEHGLYQKNISAFEKAYNIPMILAGPSIKKIGHCSARVGIHDLCQTILSLAGCEEIKTKDSCSFVDILNGSDEGFENWQTAYAEYHGGRILLTQRVVWHENYKYVFNGFDEDELYDLSEDPYELCNLIDDEQYSLILKDMIKIMWKKIKETGDHSLEKTFYASLRLAKYGSLI